MIYPQEANVIHVEEMDTMQEIVLKEEEDLLILEGIIIVKGDIKAVQEVIIIIEEDIDLRDLQAEEVLEEIQENIGKEAIVGEVEIEVGVEVEVEKKKRRKKIEEVEAGEMIEIIQKALKIGILVKKEVIEVIMKVIIVSKIIKIKTIETQTGIIETMTKEEKHMKEDFIIEIIIQETKVLKVI